MAKTQCRKCGQVYEITEVGAFKCSACGEFLPPVAIAVNEEKAPAVSAVPAAVTTPIAPAASPERKSRKGVYILLAVTVVVLLVAIAIGIGVYAGSNQDKPADRSSVPVSQSAEAASKIITLPGDVKMQLNLVKAGSFIMGSPESESWRGKHETNEKQHTVTLTQDYYMGVTEVTQGQWQAIMETTIDDQRKKARASNLRGEGKNHPIYYVSWEEAMEFCNKLNEQGYAPQGWKFTLPTEAQWEYACRAGSKTAYSWGDSLNGDKANCDGILPYNTSTGGECIGKTTPVKSYAPNAWGLYDMHGNVGEWCADWYGDYPSGSVTDPAGPGTGSYRVYRGGDWCNIAVDCRSAARLAPYPFNRFSNIGFRVALVAAD